ncbi:MAG: cytochrome c oxidase subunit 3 [Bacteroidota bacterium]
MGTRNLPEESDRPYELGEAASENLSFHPRSVFMTLLLISLVMLFLALSAAFVYNRIQSELPPLQLPLLFLVNTAILLAGSYCLNRAKVMYKTDNTSGYIRMLEYTLALTVLFLVAQILAWYQLFEREIFASSDNSAGYLYVISFLHFLHVIGGIPFLVVFLINARKKMVEPVSVLVYFSDPDKRLDLKLLSMYWHFLDGLWIYLVLFFFAYQVIF